MGLIFLGPLLRGFPHERTQRVSLQCRPPCRVPRCLTDEARAPDDSHFAPCGGAGPAARDKMDGCEFISVLRRAVGCGTPSCTVVLVFGRYTACGLWRQIHSGAPAGGEVQVCAHGRGTGWDNGYTAGKCVKSSGASAGVITAPHLRRRAGAGRRGRHAHCRSRTPRWRPVRLMGLAGRG